MTRSFGFDRIAMCLRRTLTTALKVDDANIDDQVQKPSAIKDWPNFLSRAYYVDPLAK